MDNINDYRLSKIDNDRMICKLQSNLGQRIIFNNTEYLLVYIDYFKVNDNCYSFCILQEQFKNGIMVPLKTIFNLLYPY